MISKYGCCCFPTLKDTKKKRRRRKEEDQDEGRVKRRDGDKCRRGNSKWKREKGE